jgi:ammonia channel protein AmtB
MTSLGNIGLLGAVISPCLSPRKSGKLKRTNFMNLPLILIYTAVLLISWMQVVGHKTSQNLLSPMKLRWME